ncbi:MAG: hypothetical protein ACM3QS_03235 [Bacteroidota bacterium]
MRLTWRTAAAVLILVLSLALLIWGFWPASRQRLVVPVDPANLTLPTPSSFSPARPAFAYLQP